MMGSYFYWQSIRRTVAVFGTLFNNIEVVRKDSGGKVLNIARVPLSYGPRQKFLSRIEQAESYEDQRIAIKLPRMGFEITSLTYDATHKMQKMHYEKFKTDEKDKAARDYAIGPVIYDMGFELSIFAKNQDDALQILEQILPFFQPQYTVTVKELKDTKKSDYPFTLTGVTLDDSYEGDYLTRRAIVYTLTFETKVRFYGDVRTHALIKKVDVNYYIKGEPDKFLTDSWIVTPWDADEDEPHELRRLRSWMNQEFAQITIDDHVGLEVGDTVISNINDSIAVIDAINHYDVEQFTDTNGDILEVVRLMDETVNPAIVISETWTNVTAGTDLTVAPDPTTITSLGPVVENHVLSLQSLDGNLEVGETLYVPRKPNYLYNILDVDLRWIP
jgi:hypothetical protein